MSIDLPTDNLLGLIMMIGGGGWLATTNGKAIVSWVLAKFRDRPTTADDPGHNSDAQPPDGFIEHVKIIHAAAPNCPSDVREGYCMAGKTEAQVLLAERQRLESPQEPTK